MNQFVNVDITLVENSTAGNQPKVFFGQIVEIGSESDTVVTSVDGFTSRGRHPSEIFWHGGTARSLKHITNVTIIQSGAVLIDAELNTFFGGPSDITGGVKFFVLKPDAAQEE
ncbi:hypothetical protein [Acidocella facilis]|jgi:hypothetical protein|uniref:hypothetical protein n=1 Tax=Acidocella facilis TaxID=525 RepID=UPI001F2F4827|nr:hypothetical protein [Acidocella facilis]